MTASSTSSGNTKRWGVLLFIGIALIASYVILPQLRYFHSSISSLRTARWSDVLIAIIASGVTSLLAAVTYQLLALRPLHYWRTFTVQLASLFTNHLLPAGIGGISISYRYLRLNKHSTEQAGLIVFLNNLIGLVGHSILLLIAVLCFNVSWPKFHGVHISSKLAAVVVIALIIVLLVLLVQANIRRKTKQLANRLVIALTLYKSRPDRVVGALGSSMLLTLTNISCLFFCMHAVGLSLSFSQCFIVFTAGLIVGTAAPTPGGLGGFEAGLLAGMLSYHVKSGPALAAVLLFRLITYWLALAVGAVSFGFASKQHII
jgi:uncharacterized membrane protein YbhN (UPF0104 family)